VHSLAFVRDNRSSEHVRKVRNADAKSPSDSVGLQPSGICDAYAYESSAVGNLVGFGDAGDGKYILRGGLYLIAAVQLPPEMGGRSQQPVIVMGQRTVSFIRQVTLHSSAGYKAAPRHIGRGHGLEDFGGYTQARRSRVPQSQWVSGENESDLLSQRASNERGMLHAIELSDQPAQSVTDANMHGLDDADVNEFADDGSRFSQVGPGVFEYMLVQDAGEGGGDMLDENVSGKDDGPHVLKLSTSNHLSNLTSSSPLQITSTTCFQVSAVWISPPLQPAVKSRLFGSSHLNNLSPLLILIQQRCSVFVCSWFVSRYSLAFATGGIFDFGVKTRSPSYQDGMVPKSMAGVGAGSGNGSGTGSCHKTGKEPAQDPRQVTGQHGVDMRPTPWWPRRRDCLREQVVPAPWQPSGRVSNRVRRRRKHSGSAPHRTLKTHGKEHGRTTK
jgi:hypothetical protein